MKKLIFCLVLAIGIIQNRAFADDLSTVTAVDSTDFTVTTTTTSPPIDLATLQAQIDGLNNEITRLTARRDSLVSIQSTATTSLATYSSTLSSSSGTLTSSSSSVASTT